MVAAVRPGRGFGPGAVVGTIWDIRDDIESGTGGVGAVGRAVCDAVASTGFNQVPLNNRTGVGYVCEPYWDDQGIDPPQDAPPFTGGQCAVQYRMGIQFINCSTGVQAGASRTVAVTGPITSVEVTDPVPGPGCGDTIDVILSGPNDTNGSTFAQIEPGTFQTTGLFRVDGQPDNCGDPPSTSVPGPNNPGTPYGEPIGIPGFPDTVITVEPPRTGPDGAPSWDVNIEIGGEPVGGPITFTPNGEPPAPPPPDIVEEPPEEVDPSGDVDAEPETEDGRLIGYRWSFPNVPSDRGEIAGTNPRIFYPVIGSIQLKIETPSGDGYGPQRQIKESSGSIFSESSDVLVRGVQWTHSTLYGSMQLIAVRVKDAG